MTHRSGPRPRRASGHAAVAVLLRTVLACTLALAIAGPAAASATPAAPAAPAAPEPTATSDDGLSWSVAPADNSQGTGPQGDDRANYEYAVEPGDRVTDAVVVTNRSATPLRLTVYGTDAFTTPSGHIDLLPADEPATGLGTWLTFRRQALDLEPGASAEVPFTLRVPDDAAPGDHSGGVVTALTQRVGDSALTVDRRLALRVHARVAGELAPGLGITGLGVTTGASPNPFGAVTSTVRYRLTNTGSARVVPSETVTVAGPGGASATTASADLDEILPGSTVDREVEVPGVRPLVRAEVTVRVDGLVVGVGGGGVTTAHDAASGWAVPWALLALVVLAVSGAVTVPLVRARRGVSPRPF